MTTYEHLNERDDRPVVAMLARIEVLLEDVRDQIDGTSDPSSGR
jgi:hypothetical protein